MKSDTKQPSEELLNKVRLIQTYLEEYAIESVKRLNDFSVITDKRLFQFRSLLPYNDIGINWDIIRRIFRNNKILYKVSEKTIIRLEFQDVIKENDTSRELEEVRKYEPGDWEQKLGPAYEKCLHIQKVRGHIPWLENRLAHIKATEDVMKLLETSEDTEYAIDLLLLSPNYESNLWKLWLMYLQLGKVPESFEVCREAIHRHPYDANLYLFLAEHFYFALCNTRGWGGVNVNFENNPFLVRLTLEVLGLDFESGLREEKRLFEAAIRLSKDTKTKTSAWNQLSTLRMMENSVWQKVSRGT
jgi:tetratricopeptide (TPR) repeat protein